MISLLCEKAALTHPISIESRRLNTLISTVIIKPSVNRFLYRGKKEKFMVTPFFFSEKRISATIIAVKIAKFRILTAVDVFLLSLIKNKSDSLIFSS